MNRLVRTLASLIPPPRNEWILAHHAERELIRTRREQWRWSLGLLAVAVSALLGQLRHEPRSFLGGTATGVLVGAASLVNALAAGGLIALLLTQSETPWFVWFIAVGLFAQAGMAVLVARGGGRRARRVQIAGSALAATFGMMGFVVGVIATLGAADPEYGPPTLAAFVAAHGIASLLHVPWIPAQR